MDSSSTYQAVDAVVSTTFSIYSSSRPRRSVQTVSDSSSARRGTAGNDDSVTENDALLGSRKSASKPFYRPRPLWLVPFAILASIVRGMTLAPRVQVYTQLSCNAIYGHDIYDHTRAFDTTLPISPAYHVPSLDLPYASNSNDAIPRSFVTSDDDDDDEPDPRRPPSERCLKDPAVQSQAARLQTVMTTTMGFLSAVTTSWWGSYGEHHGRTRVLTIATFGLFMTDLVFILVSTPHSVFAAHGHKLLIISPIIEGLCGGWTTLQAATSAYISDCTSDGSRASIFSRFTGVFYFGFAVGPTIGAFLIRHPFIPIFSPAIGVHNGAPTVTSVFFVAATASLVNLILAMFLFPESLHKKKAKAAAATQPLPMVTAEPSNSSVGSSDKPDTMTRMFGPLALFLPKTIQRSDGSRYTDWRMTLLAVVLFGHLLSLGLFQLKYLYAEHIYGWDAEKLSYYISFMGSSRALHLLLILPFVIATFKPNSQPKQQLPKAGATSKPNTDALSREMQFDMSLIRGSLLIDLFSHSLVVLSPLEYGPFAGQALFVGATAMSSFGAGLVPAVNSLALCIMQSREDLDTGKMFGAFSVLQATGQMIIGPVLFGVIYSKTVATFPKTIFAVAGCIIFVTIVVLLLLRPDAGVKPRGKVQHLGPGGVESQVETVRGRSRKSKDIRQSSLISEVYVPSPGTLYGATSCGQGSGSG